MNTSLVTGGAGFIGAHVVNKLIELNHKVIVLDDLSGGFEENINPSAIFIKGSITDEKLLADIFQKYPIDFVYHLAAYAAEGLSHFIRRFNYTNNLIGSVNLINESIKNKVKCFVFTSSIAVYGTGQLPLTEETIPQPEDPYGISKYAIELDLKAAHEMFGLDFIIFRPHNVYGEYQNIGDRYRNVIGIFMNQLLQNKPLTVFGDGSQTRAFSYINDVAPCIANSVNVKSAYNEVFNIGADINYSITDLTKEVMRAMHKEMPVQYLPARNEVLHAYSDHQKVKKAFHIEKQFTSLDEGLAAMAQWAIRTGSRKSNAFNNIEIHENLPSIWTEKINNA